MQPNLLFVDNRVSIATEVGDFTLIEHSADLIRLHCSGKAISTSLSFRGGPILHIDVAYHHGAFGDWRRGHFQVNWRHERVGMRGQIARIANTIDDAFRSQILNVPDRLASLEDRVSACQLTTQLSEVLFWEKNLRCHEEELARAGRMLTAVRKSLDEATDALRAVANECPTAVALILAHDPDVERRSALMMKALPACGESEPVAEGGSQTHSGTPTPVCRAARS